MQLAQDPPNPRVAKRSLRLLGMLLGLALPPAPPPPPPGDGGKYSFAGLQRAAATRTKSTYKQIIMVMKIVGIKPAFDVISSSENIDFKEIITF